MHLMNKMMFTVYESNLDFEETVSTIIASAEKNGWKIPMTHDLQKEYQESGYADMTKMTIIYFCNPDGGYKILQDDENKPMSVMMPTGVSVYETHEGQVCVAGMNLERMSMVFGGIIKEVLREGGKNIGRTMEDIAEPKVEGDELKAYGGRCCLGCISVSVILGVLAALLIAFFVKVMPIIMPKIMAKMMPKMMKGMEEAGVQPPCAKIILEYLEKNQPKSQADR